MAGSEAAKLALFLSRFLDELGHGTTEPIELGMDNQAAIAISYNPELHARTKHIDRRHFFIRECYSLNRKEKKAATYLELKTERSSLEHFAP